MKTPNLNDAFDEFLSKYEANKALPSAQPIKSIEICFSNRKAEDTEHEAHIILSPADGTITRTEAEQQFQREYHTITPVMEPVELPTPSEPVTSAEPSPSTPKPAPPHPLPAGAYRRANNPRYTGETEDDEGWGPPPENN